MSVYRKVLLPLLLIPLGMFIYVWVYPDWQWETPGLEVLFAAIGLPILAVNFIAWFYPEVLQGYFPIKDAPGQRTGLAVTVSVVVSTLVALACVGAGAASAIASADVPRTARSSRGLPITATAFARSLLSLSSATEPGLPASASTPRPSPEASLIPEETLQSTISEATGTNAPLFSAAQATAASTSSAPAGTTRTTVSAQSCTAAAPQYLQPVQQAVQDADSENVVQAGWMVRSQAADNLWFVGAKIQSDTGTVLSGVWGVFIYSDGSSDLYAINDVAQEVTYAAWGDDSDPVLSMQSDGAQTVYNCAAQAP